MEASISQMEMLLSFFIDLDEESRNKVLAETVTLAYEKTRKKQLQAQPDKKKRGKKHTGFSQTGIEDGNNATVISHLKTAFELTNRMDEASPNEKAAIILSMFNMGILDQELEKPEIKVSVTYRRMEIQEYILQMIPLADMESSQRIYKEKYKPIVDSITKKGESHDQL